MKNGSPTPPEKERKKGRAQNKKEGKSRNKDQD